MNLPGDAVLFLDVFNGFLLKADGQLWHKDNLPMIHVYTFSPGESVEEARTLVIQRVLDVMPAF